MAKRIPPPLVPQVTDPTDLSLFDVSEDRGNPRIVPYMCVCLRLCGVAPRGASRHPDAPCVCDGAVPTAPTGTPTFDVSQRSTLWLHLVHVVDNCF
jgi:hypothetical protein